MHLSNMLRSTKKRVARQLRQTTLGSKALAAAKAARSTAPVVPAPEQSAASDSAATPEAPVFSVHTAKDVTSTDDTKFALTFYSQFGEDAVLRGYFRRREEDRLRAGGAAPASQSPIGDGFYVDVGCYHPSRFSNTLHFYKSGWNGINVDATVGTTELFDGPRPRDTTIEVAVSEVEGETTFFTSGYGGRSVFNTVDPDQAETYRNSGRVAKHREVTVPALRLETILDRHLPKGQIISFLDVDVEGHDLAVLRSNDWDRYRPLVVIVESHLVTIDEVVTDEAYLYMREQGYVLQSWVRPNMIFRES